MGPVRVFALRVLAVAVTMTLAVGQAGSAADATGIATFSSAPLGDTVPPGWEATRLPKVPHATAYRIVEDGGTRVLRAQARASMAGLTYRLHADPSATPILAWRWKIDDVVGKGAFGTKAGDDFAARVYVLFDYDVSRLSFGTWMKLKIARALYGDAVPAAALCYVWDAKAPVGTAAWSPFTDRLRMIVATSGSAQAGQWVAVERDVAADFRAAFGEDAPPIAAVAIATDTDNTGASVTAWYGDLALLPPRGVSAR